ncbi:hypothetical protein B0H16DRAFT_1474428 [Mycena metata]|uniref:CxC2-like cysteine cluster KDZ transposase-associated domain-containing protein n=1 Tax=Mycena metata TaxID=1033252 RepID=A0AAD7MK34_9AGAR|nr:hypothetical protein B0H16DRAFT_1474428 [Mycena metata]
MLNCLGKVSAHDFLRSLELLANNDGLSRPPQRRRAFRHIVRQYRTSLMMKRAGRGHALSGVAGTAQGELALNCRACPHVGRNLPDGYDKINWAEMPEDLRYKYFLFLAQDCNFRLINRNVSSEAKDPIIGDGLGYFVNHEQYAKYLWAHVSDEEISTCSGFQAMFLANRKRVKGLRTTGVGGVTCARHNMWRPNGIGDLQLGERQCNMDFILWSALLNTIIFYLTSSSCTTSCVNTRSTFGTAWNRRRRGCGCSWSARAYGRTHGETVEQNWEFTNGAAPSTKMMGFGTRAATLEDLFGFHNWRRLVAWRGIFTKRMGENVKEGQVHRDAFEAFDAALREAAPELVEGWEVWVKEWESKQHTDGSASPFEAKVQVTSMRDIRLKLAREELLRSGEGVEVEREDTPSTFIMMGLEIEQTQNLAVDVKALANPTEAQALAFLKRQTALTKRIRAFRKLQRTYMPNVRRFLTATQRALWDTEAEREAEGVRLFMPSEMADKTKRERACAVGLGEVEAELRIGEARQALEELREGLRTRTMTNRYRLRHCSGQRMLTRGQGILRQINVKIHKAKLHYRYVQHALTRLKEHGAWERELRVLEDSDIRALNERALTEEEAAQRQGVHDLEEIAEEGGIAAMGAVALGEGRRTLSWIWYTAKTTDPTEAELVEALRVEWCKAYARMRRWHEDVVLVEEEMRRTIAYGYWSGMQWRARASERASSGVSDELQEGLTAYAMEQSDREERTCAKLGEDWAKIRAKGRAYLARETISGENIVVAIGGGDAGDEDDEDDEEEEGAPDYEDEGDDEVVE